MNLKITLSILAIIGLVIIGAIYFYYKEKVAIRNIQNFEDCKENGFPIQESYPSRCMTPDGRSFTEDASVPPTDLHTNLIQVETPTNGQIVSSPIQIKGQARGYWFFEASFPLSIIDSKGVVIATSSVRADGEWMTENFVPFSVSLSYKSSTTQSATLVLHKDNPSGLPENDDFISIPIILEAN